MKNKFFQIKINFNLIFPRCKSVFYLRLNKKMGNYLRDNVGISIFAV